LDPSKQAGFRGYVSAKAKMLRKMGVENYRQEDFFDQPPEDLDPEELEDLLRGSRTGERTSDLSSPAVPAD
jgi:hypothetical protein